MVPLETAIANDTKIRMNWHYSKDLIQQKATLIAI